MTCKRCLTPIKFLNHRCFDMNDKPHYIYKCKTAPGKIWCPLCRDIFSQRSPCRHYIEFHYKPRHNEASYIKFISIKSIKPKPKETKPKEVWCDKCHTIITYMNESQRLTHNKLHQHQENNQAQLFKLF